LLTIADKKRFFAQLETIRKNQNECFKVTPLLESFKKSDILNPWLKGEIQNQELLLKLNKYGSRSFNDLSAYPIFPWVLTDYKSDLHSFEEAKSRGKVYRDFGKVTAIFNEESKDEIQNRYECRVETMQEQGIEGYKMHFMDWKLFGADVF